MACGSAVETVKLAITWNGGESYDSQRLGSTRPALTARHRDCLSVRFAKLRLYSAQHRGSLLSSLLWRDDHAHMFSDGICLV